MESREITRDQISILPHRAKAAFAVDCVRIAWDGLTRRHWSDPPKYLEGALSDLERFAKDPLASPGASAAIAEMIPSLVARADSEPGGQCTSALARSICEAVATVSLATDVACDGEIAANHASEAYRWALHATRIAPLGAAVLAEREFLAAAKKAFDARLGNVPATLTGDTGHKH
jgi:hypothetical protein